MNTPYELLGGEAGVRQLSQELYRVMSGSADAKTIRDMHAEDLSGVSDKLFMFLSGWLGGPNLYLQKYGTICLSTPHSKYAIGPAERDQWLACMDGALDNVGASADLKAMLKEPMFNLADVMCNRD
ncbi:MAG: group II truncated hemoglobin [Oceanospirillaceae bacterium]|nr:group II truncated hemoglobin [Oceanospirillaceae bacterium]